MEKVVYKKIKNSLKLLCLREFYTKKKSPGRLLKK